MFLASLLSYILHFNAVYLQNEYRLFDRCGHSIVCHFTHGNV